MTSSPGNTIASPNAAQRSLADAASALTARHAAYPHAAATPSVIPTAPSARSLDRAPCFSGFDIPTNLASASGGRID